MAKQLFAPRRFERHHRRCQSGEVGKIPVFDSLKELRKKYGPKTNYWRITLPKGAE